MEWMIVIHSEYSRIRAIDRFEDALKRALIYRLWDRLSKRLNTLLSFELVQGCLLNPGGIHQGIQEIPVNYIVGSLAKADEFDRKFHPLFKNQRKRWINVWELHAQGGWEPIIVHQVGDKYFVEDGHHRLSVAREMGLKTIQTAVTNYPAAISLDQNQTLEDILAEAARI